MCKYDFIFGCVNDLFGFSMREREREWNRKGKRKRGRQTERTALEWLA